MRRVFQVGIALVVVTVALAIAGSSLYAQRDWPAVYVLKTDTSATFTLPESHWQMLGTSDSIGLKEIGSPEWSARFHANTTNERNLSYITNTYWQRYRIMNALNHTVNLAVAEGNADASVIYRIDSGAWKQQRTGYLVPWSERDGLKKIATVTMAIPAGKVITIYERNRFDYRYTRPQKLIVQLGFADRLLRDAYINTENSEFKSMIGTFITGLVFFAALLNLFFFAAVKEKVYLFYGLTLLSSMIRSTASPLAGIYRENPIVYYYVEIVFFTSQFFFFIQANRYFINLKRYYPRLDRLLFLANILAVVTYLLAQLILPLIKPEWANSVNVIYLFVSAAIFVVLLITLLLFITKKDFNSRVYVISALPVVTWISLEYVSDIFPGTTFQNWYNDVTSGVTAVCISWLLILFTWALIRRFAKLKQENARKEIEKERLAKEKEMERNELIAAQKINLEKEVAERTAALKASLENLKATQSQLIQSEKMASLGELTAGIAHEIQNPLNFVNNFSEVSIELIDEMEEELTKGDKQEAMAIAGDIKTNLEKIGHHGKRADSIVKGMLQHSRSGDTQKEFTDLNVIADEYLKLSYHGLRSKDKSFNAELITELDPSLPQAYVLPQDIGRVLLNLYTNAFYAVHKKQLSAGEDYTPTVVVKTCLHNGQFSISVRDNGDGIPPHLVDKIMQPFFTTKPTGEGTGLGLSMSYDIITKAHGGELLVETEEGAFTVFTIQLPVK